MEYYSQAEHKDATIVAYILGTLIIMVFLLVLNWIDLEKIKMLFGF